MTIIIIIIINIIIARCFLSAVNLDNRCISLVVFYLRGSVIMIFNFKKNFVLLHLMMLLFVQSILPINCRL